MSRKPREKRPLPVGAAFAAGGTGLAAAVAALAPNGNFALTFTYVACTLAVCAVATLVTIRVLIRLWLGKTGDLDATGMVEVGLLIGLFVVSPLALTGAFQLLEAVVGGL